MRIAHPIAEDCGLAILLRILDCGLEHLAETGSMKDIITENKARAVIADELLADNERLSESVRRRLLRIREVYAIITSVSQKPFEARKVVRSGDDENIPDSSQHED